MTRDHIDIKRLVMTGDTPTSYELSGVRIVARDNRGAYDEINRVAQDLFRAIRV